MKSTVVGALSLSFLASCVSTPKEPTWGDLAIARSLQNKTSLPLCSLIISGYEWGYDTEFEHENAHCWGWIHQGRGTLLPPSQYSLALRGVYPNIYYPFGKVASYGKAQKYCLGASACQWYGKRHSLFDTP